MVGIQNQPYITRSDIFEGHPELEAAWQRYDHKQFEWGCNTRSLIRPLRMEESINDAIKDLSFTESEIAPVLRRLRDLPDNCLVDLEN